MDWTQTGPSRSLKGPTGSLWISINLEIKRSETRRIEYNCRSYLPLSAADADTSAKAPLKKGALGLVGRDMSVDVDLI